MRRGRCEVGVRRGGRTVRQETHTLQDGWEAGRGSEAGREEGVMWRRGGGLHGFVSAEDTQRREMGWLI